jgi:hypothetical protein
VRVLVVPTPTEVRGSISNRATGLPLEAATLCVLEGTRRIGALEVASPESYALRFWSRSPSVFVEAKALGFANARSPALHLTADELTWDAALVEVVTLDELVLDQEGHAVDWGETCVVRPGATPRLVNGTLRAAPSGPGKIRIRGDGRLALNRPPEPFALAIVTRSGFGWITSHELDAGKGIRVEPWSRVEGHCAAEAGAPATVRLEFDRFAHDADGLGLRMEYVTTTDVDGTFRFRSIPAGAVRVVPAARPEDALEANLAAGETTYVPLR